MFYVANSFIKFMYAFIESNFKCFVYLQFGNCSSVFGLKEDLEYHLEKDHILRKKNLARCHWSICCYVFPPNWNVKVKSHVFFKCMLAVCSSICILLITLELKISHKSIY